MTSQARQQILDAARDQILEPGIDSLSVRSIARRAHYSPAGLYRHFESIEGIRSSLTSQIEKDLTVSLLKSFSGDETPSGRNLAREVKAWIGRNGVLTELLLSQPASDFMGPDEDYEWINTIGRHDLSFERRRAVAVFAWDGLRSIIHVHSFTPEIDLDEILDRFIGFVLDLLDSEAL